MKQQLSVPELQVDYKELVSGMRREFLGRGLLRPVKMETFLETKLDAQMMILSENLRGHLKMDWVNLFPGVEYSEANLCRKVEDYLVDKKREALEKFKAELARKEKVRQWLGFIFKPDQLNFFVVSLISIFILYPSFFVMFFSPSDSKLFLGMIGILVTAIADIGNRETTIANKAMGGTPPINTTEGNNDNAEGYQAELLTAFREYTFFPTPGVRFLSFPKGNQVYSFTSGKSIESNNDEGFKLNAMDGKVSFDGTVQMHVDENLPDIKERLLKFVKTFSLTQYAGSDNVLTDFMSSRFKPILYAGFQNYVSGKRVLEVVRGKKDINDHMAKYMNEKFNEYGLTFTMVAITSAMSFDTEQQERMNRIIIKEAESSAMKIRNEKVLPLTKEIAKLELDGKDEEAKLMYEANSQSITTIANAWKTRRDLIIAQIGKDNYFRFEQSKLMVNALMEKKTSVKLVPSGANLFIGNNNTLTAIPAAKELEVLK